MSGASRPLVLTPEESGGANLSASDAVGSRGAHSTAADARGGLHMRNSRSPRRSSSGYFSNDSDSLPSSPLFQRPHTADEATQTVSPSAQVIEHAVRSLAAARGESAHQVQHGRSSALPANSMGDTPAVEVGRVLREQGDAYNRLLTRRTPPSA
ncbi:bcl-2-like protein 11 [Eucyclogobius newberryi]|uniref:bcl-2-like protein 11 n=1 Tax=Eucyclogobius newberryi TaxID=166745 RepID=UPI003B5BEDD4